MRGKLFYNGLFESAYSQSCPRKTLCNKGFSISSRLKEHYHRHGMETLYICDIYNKALSQSIAYRNHRRLHMGKSFIYVVCRKDFRTNTALNFHFRIHTKKRPYVCEVCNEEFSYKDALEIYLCTRANETRNTD